METAGIEVINHEGVVTSNSGKSVIVSISSQSACSGCHAKVSCNILGPGEKLIEVEGSYNVIPGDVVNILMKQSLGFKALAYGYLLPFAAVITILIIMVSLEVHELTAGLVSFGTLFPYYFLLYCFRDRISRKFTFSLKV